MRTIQKLRAIAALTIATALITPPALAMNWKIYAPDEGSTRYWMDADSVSTGGGYTYVYFYLGQAGSSAPTTTSSPNLGIKCDTGDSVKLQDGEWVAGNHFTRDAFLFNALCPAAR